jgi:hypothetical protein
MITQEGFDPWVYDIDEDCYISAAERDQALADWQSGIITMSNYMAVVNLWEWNTRNPACGIPPVFDPWSYDADGDCYISTSEKDKATVDYQSGVITMSNLMAVVNLWEWSTRNPACGPQTCLVDADCPEGYVCQNGVCVKKKAFPWRWLAIGGAAIVGVILLIRKPKKAVKK